MRWDYVIFSIVGIIGIWIIMHYLLIISKVMLYTIALIEGKPVPKELALKKPKRNGGERKISDLKEIQEKLRGLG